MSEEQVKIIAVTGGVISGVGKGIVSSSLGVLLKAHGYRVTAIKIDPYFNIDAGTFAPGEHGEVFVLDDGGEVDLDLGNYERFLNVCLSRDNNITTGKIMKSVIEAERAGKYLGKTVQYVPHVTNKIREWILKVAQRPVDNTDLQPHVCIVELGGTVGDMESMAYLYTLSQFTTEEWKNRFFHVHVSMLVDLDSGELKTKPLQNGMAEIRSKGLRPDLVVCRSTKEITQKIKQKISETCVLSLSQVIGIHNLPNIYQVPLEMLKQGVLKIMEDKLGLIRGGPSQILQNCPNIEQWKKLTELVDKYKENVKIALVGKYFEQDHTKDAAKFKDAYASIIKALQHSATHSERKLELIFVAAENLEDKADEDRRKHAWDLLKSAQGILVPGGFGYRGVEGKILACKYARENKIPFLGVCLGMQCAAIEFARNVCGIKKANSTEFAKDLNDEEQIVIDMPEHHGGDMGGTMRLGKRVSVFLTKQSKLYKLYGENDAIEERHRHRYEINPKNVSMMNSKGLRFVGMGADENNPVCGSETTSIESKRILRLALSCKNVKNESEFCDKVEELCERGTNTNVAIRMEMLELSNHPYFVGVQYHPEYTSHPLQPSSPFLGLLLAATEQLNSYIDGTRLPSPVDLFKNVDSPSESHFHFLPSAGNSSASLLASLNDNIDTKYGNELTAPNHIVSTPPVSDENSSPVFTSKLVEDTKSIINSSKISSKV